MKSVLLATTGIVALVVPISASAQIDDEIVVTATKREQTLQEVPIAVSVVQAETIQDAQINDIVDLQSVVPALSVSQLERSNNTTFSIRGFGNGANNPGIEPSIAVFIDGVFRTRTGAALGDFPNLARVEVLRGPQSTLFGKNASAGVVSFVTEEPQFEWSGLGEITFGNYDQRIAKAYVTGPLSDTVAFSFAAGTNQRDGYFDNLGSGGEYNDRDRYFLRGQILAQPTDALSFRFIADYDELGEQCCGTIRVTDGTGGLIRGPRALGLLGSQTSPVGTEDYVIATDFENLNQIENGGVSLQADYDITPDITLTSITAYRELDEFVNYEGDFTTAELLGNNIRGLESETFTQELRFAGSTGRFDWLVGGFYFDETVDIEDSRLYGVDTRAYVDLLSAAGTLPGTMIPDASTSAITTLENALGFPAGTFWAAGNGVSFNATQDDRQFQLFTQVDFRVTDRLTLTGGVSYFDAKKEVDFTDVTRTNPFSDLNFVQIGAGLIQQGAFAQAFLDNTGLPATPENIALVGAVNPEGLAAIQAGAQAFAQANATNPDVNPLLALYPALQPLGPLTPFPNSVESGETNDDDIPFTLRAAYDVTDRINVYGSYATGFKASSWNLTPDTRPFAADIPALQAAGILAPDNALGQPSIVNTAIALGQYAGTRFAEPETTKVFELGLKASFGWGQVNLAAFDQTIEDFQSSLFQGTGFVLSNAGEQSAQGIEFDATVSPLEGLTFTIAGLVIDAEYDEFVGAPVATGSEADLADGVADGVADLSGQRPAGIADFRGSFGAEYRRSFSMGEAFIRADYQYESDTQVVDNIPEDILSREVNNLNASIGMNFENGFEALVWGRNLTDAFYSTSGFPTTLQPGSFSAYPNPPRTYGVTLRKRF